MNLSIMVPMSLRPIATRDTGWHVESPGTTTAPDDAEIVLSRCGQEARVNLREIGSRLLAAWAYPISENAYRQQLAEVEAEHARVEGASDKRKLTVAHADRGWLLAQLRERDAALRAAKVLERDGTLGEMGETICRLADMLRGVPVKVEHRCADPKVCPPCSVRRPVDPVLHVEEPARRGMEQAESDGSEAGSDKTHAGTIAAASESRKENRQESIPSPRTEDVLAIARKKGDLSQVPDDALDVAIEVASAREAAALTFGDLTREHRILLRLQREAARRIESAHERVEVERAKAANEPTLVEAGRALDRVLSGLTEEQRQHLTALADPAVRARFNGSTARIRVIDAPVPADRREAARMREYINREFDLSITTADLATALGIPEADVVLIEAGGSSTDAAGWVEIQTALFALGGGMKPEHIADPESDPAFQQAMDRNDDDAPEETDPAPKDGPAFFESSFGEGRETWDTPEGQRFLREMRGGLNEHSIETDPEKTGRPWHRDRAVVVRASNRLNEEVAREAAKATETLLRKPRPVPARGRGDTHTNIAWIREHSAPYGGQWVALRDGALVRANKNRSVLLDSLEQSGDLDVLLVKIEENPERGEDR